MVHYVVVANCTNQQMIHHAVLPSKVMLHNILHRQNMHLNAPVSMNNFLWTNKPNITNYDVIVTKAFMCRIRCNLCEKGELLLCYMYI